MNKNKYLYKHITVLSYHSIVLWACLEHHHRLHRFLNTPENMYGRVRMITGERV